MNKKLKRTKKYLGPGTRVEATSVEMVVIESGTRLVFSEILPGSNLNVWDAEKEEWRDVQWDWECSPAKLYYNE